MSSGDVVVVGTSSREYAIALAFAKHPHVQRALVVPGNPVVASLNGASWNANTELGDVGELVRIITAIDPDFVVIGDERALFAGLADALSAEKLRVFGATRGASQVERSKVAGRFLFERCGLPCERWSNFQDERSCTNALHSFGPPWVIKAEYAVSGSGVTVTSDFEEARAVIGGAFRIGRQSVMLHEFILGEETTVVYLVRGSRIRQCWAYHDYKRLLDGNRGPLTSSMGAVAASARDFQQLLGRCQRLVDALELENGILELNLVRSAARGLYTLEANVNLGIPAAEALVWQDPLRFAMPFFDDDTCTSATECVSTAVAIVIASPGYPLRRQETPITEIVGDDMMFFPNAITRRLPSGQLVGAGRLATLVVRAAGMAEAAESLRLKIPNGYACRKDVGLLPAMTA